MPIKRGWLHFLCKHTESRNRGQSTLSAGELKSLKHTQIRTHVLEQISNLTPLTNNNLGKNNTFQNVPCTLVLLHHESFVHISNITSLHTFFARMPV